MKGRERAFAMHKRRASGELARHGVLLAFVDVGWLAAAAIPPVDFLARLGTARAQQVAGSAALAADCKKDTVLARSGMAITAARDTHRLLAKRQDLRDRIAPLDFAHRFGHVLPEDHLAAVLPREEVALAHALFRL
eukprot:3866725-Prymnesium_polylepis.1